MKYLGIDYGKKKIGLAVSEGDYASPFDVLHVSGLGDALLKIEKVILEQGIGVVVLGLPESGEAREIAKKFANRMRQKIEVLEVEETLSTVRAKKIMVEMGIKKSKSEDPVSASIILQDFLDSK